MAEFNLKLNINGVETAVASVEDLETALKATKEEMKTLQIGSEAFNVAAVNAQKLDSALKNVKLSTEGVDTKQLAGSFAKLGETVGGAFAIATNAAGIFGVKNDQVAAASAKAQQAIAVVMGARAIAEGIVEGRVAARLIVEKLAIANQAIMTTLTGAYTAVVSGQAVATEGAAIAQTGLNVAMLANPIFLVIAALAALVAGIAYLATAEESEIERTQRLAEEREKYLEVLNKSIGAYRETASIATEQMQNELDIMISAGASKEELYNKEQLLLTRKIKTLEVIASSARDLSNDEIKELNKLNAQRIILQNNYNNDIKESQTKLQDDERALKEKDAEAKSKIDADSRKRANDQRIASAKTLSDALKALEATTQAEELALQAELFPAKKDILDRQQKAEEEFLTNKTNSAIAAANKDTDILLAIETLKQKGMKDIQDKFDLQRKAAQQTLTDAEEIKRLDQYKKETDLYNKLNSDRASIRLSGLKGIELIEEKHNQAIAALDQKTSGLKKDISDLKIQDKVKEAEALTAVHQNYIDALKVIDEQYEASKKENDEINYQAKLQQTIDQTNTYANISAQSAQSTVDIIRAINEGADQERMQAINAQTSAEENELRAKLNGGLITRKQYDAQEKLLQDKKAKLEYDAKKKAFEQEKKLRIASTIISGIMGALQAFTGAMQLGPIAGPIVGGILAGLVVAGTALTVKNISKQQFDGGSAPLTPINADAGSIPDMPGPAGPSTSSGGMTSFNPTLTEGEKPAKTTTQDTTPQKIVVLEYDITKAQRSVSVAENSATF